MRRLRLTSANDLRDIALTLEIQSRKKNKGTITINEKYKELVAPERKEDIYFSVLREVGVMSQPYEILQEKCRALRLAETAKELPNLLREAEAKGWTYYEFIHEILSYELSCREKKNSEKLMKWAEFPEVLTFENFRLIANSKYFKT